MSKNYDMIATVDIDIENPIVDDTSFDNLLIVGPLPKVAPDTAPAMVGVYSSIDEVMQAGWVVTGDEADPVGVAAMVAFSQSPAPAAIYIAPVQALGEEADSGVEKAVATIQRAMSTPGWYVACTAGIESSEFEEISAYIETQEKMFVYSEESFFGVNDDGTNKSAVSPVYYRTAGIYVRENKDQSVEDIPSANRYMNVAWVTKWLNYESGSETAAFKQLNTVYSADLSTTDLKALVDANLNYFLTVGNKKVTMNGKTMAGEWMDIIRFRDWQKNDMQVRVANLFTSRGKVPYTDSGIGLVQNQMMASLKAGQDVGGIAEDEFDEDGNTIPGFTTSVPLAASLASAEKASRKLTRCTFKARLAGAIHFAEIKGSLTYEL